VSTAQGIATAVLAKLNTAIAPKVAYELDKAPTSGADFAEITLSRRFGGNERGGRLSPSSWRLTVRAVGSTLANARLLHENAQAIEGFVLTVGSETSTPVLFETEEPIGLDEAQRLYWTGLRSFTFSF
jgi:hypothetical protein